MEATAQLRPRARPPGPRGKFPGQILLSFRRDPLAFLTNLTRRWGDVVQFRIGGRAYVFLNHPDFIRDVIVAQSHRFTKGPALQRAKVTLGEGLLTSEGELHRRQRRLSQPAFAVHRVNHYADAMVQEAARVRDWWVDGQVIDIHEQMMELTLAIAGRTLFGADVQKQVHEIGQAMSISVGMFTRAMMPWAPILNRLPLPSNFRFRRAQRLLFDTIDGIIQQRRRAGSNNGDFLSMLLAARDTEGDGTGMSDQQLRDEAITIFTAGHETTANALTYTWHLLARHPEVAQKMANEVDEVVGSRLPTADDVPKLKSTRMVLSESMRLYPPVWAIGRKAVEPWSAGGYEFAPGTVVLMSQWVMHHDERFWPDPLRFDPQRWANAASSDRPRLAYFPFSLGPRGCIGENFAWLEAILVLATIAKSWSLHEADHTELKLRPTITLRPAHPLRMLTRRR
ncbi:MAG TPA: cytochrome P450 [Tepidisphaeraceae bacterium]|nr:cytochrome P450 [Tepidisphaeraceae bacterium]